MREFDWIARYFAPLATADAALGLCDDAALITLPENTQLVITTDTLNEHIHFLANTPPDLIARKALAVNLSDLAAMGATPRYYSLALSLPRATDEAWIRTFSAGLAAMQADHAITLIGGDTTATDGPLCLSITAYGTCKASHALTRGGASSHDLIYVSGTIGDAVVGLEMARQNTPHPLRHRYETPVPRVALGQALVGIASACMDISDGLIQDLGHLCRASGLGATLSAEAVPLDPASQVWMAATQNDRSALLSGGDDYELLFTAAPTHSAAIQTIAASLGIAITAIGTMHAGNGVMLLDETGKAITLSQTGYQHF